MGAQLIGALTYKEALAVSAYAGYPNKNQALIAAGYSDPHSQIDRVFDRPRVQSAIAKIREKLSEDYIVKTAVARIRENLELESRNKKNINQRVKVGYFHNDTIRTIAKLCADDPKDHTLPSIIVMGDVNVDAVASK